MEWIELGVYTGTTKGTRHPLPTAIKFTLCDGTWVLNFRFSGFVYEENINEM